MLYSEVLHIPTQEGRRLAFRYEQRIKAGDDGHTIETEFNRLASHLNRCDVGYIKQRLSGLMVGQCVRRGLVK